MLKGKEGKVNGWEFRAMDGDCEWKEEIPNSTSIITAQFTPS